MRTIGTPPTESVIEDASQFLDTQPKQDFLRAPEAHRVAEGANRPADHMHHSCVVRVVEHEFRIVHVEMVGAGNGDVVLDEVGPRVALREVVVAETHPEEVPVITVGGVGARRDGSVQQVAGAFGEVKKLGLDADVPVGVVFKDEGGGIALLDDSVVAKVRALIEKKAVPP